MAFLYGNRLFMIKISSPSVDALLKARLGDGVLAILLCLLIAILSLEHVPALRKSLLILLFISMLCINAKGLMKVYRQAWPMLLWAALCTVSWFWSIRPQSTSGHLRHDLLYALLAFGIFSVITERPLSRIGVGWGLLLCSLLNALIAYFGYYQQMQWAAYYYTDVGYSSTIAVICIAFAIPLLLEERRVDWSAWIIFISSLAAGFISMNRMFIVVLLLMILSVFCIKFRHFLRRKSKALRMVLVIFIIVLFAFWMLKDTSIFNKFGMIDKAGNVRWEIAKMWLELALEKPILGIGYGRDVGQYTLGIEYREVLSTIDSLATMHSHNLFLNAFLETGAVGLVLFLSMWASFLVCFYRQWRKGSVSGLQGLMIVSFFLIKNLTDIFLLKSVNVLLFGLIGYLLSAGSLSEKQSEVGNGRQKTNN